MAFSLAKGFGCNGGGVVVPEAGWEKKIRCYGMPYAFSTPLDFSVSGAALASLELHRDGTVARLQTRLRQTIERFGAHPEPIQMIAFDTVEQAQQKCQQLLNQGYFTSLVFYPIVPRNRPQLRVCLTAAHSNEEVDGLRLALSQ
jgi:7-keto-8-aminopelargonate synthetase-like enzyme